MTMHHEKCYQRRGVPADLPPDLCDCRTLRMLDEHGQRTMRLLDAIDAAAHTEAHPRRDPGCRICYPPRGPVTRFGRLHRLAFYRYRIPDEGLQVHLNTYPGMALGISVALGRWAYCVKWGWTR